MADDDVYDLLEEEEQAERDVLAEREAALARELEIMRKRQARLVDPLQYAMSIAAEDLASYVPTFAWEMGPASAAQLSFLEKRGTAPQMRTPVVCSRACCPSDKNTARPSCPQNPRAILLARPCPSA